MTFTMEYTENEPEVSSSVYTFTEKVRDAKAWHLTIMEDIPSLGVERGTTIDGQFTPQELTYNLGSSLPEGGGFSRTHPVVQWVGGNVETLSFQARLFSQHKDDNSAFHKFEQLKILRRALPPMNRPPLTNFFWGRAFPGGIPCFVESLGGVKYDEIRDDGSVRGMSLTITLKRTVPIRVERNVETPMEQTPIHNVRHGETYEMIAMRRWGDPMLGIPLRRLNPRFPMKKWAPKNLADLEPNDQIKLFDRKDMTKERIKPTSHIFDEDDQVSADIRRYYFEARGRKSIILPRR